MRSIHASLVVAVALAPFIIVACAKASSTKPGAGGAGGEGGEISSNGPGGPGNGSSSTTTTGGGGMGGMGSSASSSSSSSGSSSGSSSSSSSSGGGSGVPAQAVWVVKVGDGINAPTSSASPVSIERWMTDGGSAGAAIAMPQVQSGNNQPFTLAGTTNSEGNLSLSGNGAYALLAGYGVTVGTVTVSTSAANLVPRVVGRIDALGNVNTQTVVTGAFSGGAVRGATSQDGSVLWVSGTSSGSTGGVHVVSLGDSVPTQILTAPNNARFLGVAAGQLYGTSGAGGYTSVFTIGAGLPTASGQTANTLPGLPTTNASPYGFALLDRNANIAGVDTLYMADDRSVATGGGIQKWVFDGSQWSLAFTITGGLSQGVRGLAARVVGNVVVIVATTAEASQNHLVMAVDDGVSTPVATSVADAPLNTVYRGVAFAPK